jgi:hypothetical protein
MTEQEIIQELRSLIASQKALIDAQRDCIAMLSHPVWMVPNDTNKTIPYVAPFVPSYPGLGGITSDPLPPHGITFCKSQQAEQNS